MTLRLSIATWDHDRTMAIHEGRVGIAGVDVESHVLPTSTLFPLAVGEARFDVTEMSVSSYVLQLSRGEGAYTAIPAFVSRAFRHAGFFARAGSGIETPSDFAGRRIGVPEYQMTAALWMRGILHDEYGVDAASVHWRTGALDAGVRRERLDLDLPPGMVVEPIGEGETLQDLLLRGEIDGLLAPKPPAAFLEPSEVYADRTGKDRIPGQRAGVSTGSAPIIEAPDRGPGMHRLFPDVEAAERDYHHRTGFFPIMHLIGVRRTLVAEHPWLPGVLMEAFTASRNSAMERLRAVWLGNANRLSLPWLGPVMERTIATMGEEYWPYGVAANRAELEAICRYSSEQYLAARPVRPEEMFPASVMDT